MSTETAPLRHALIVEDDMVTGMDLQAMLQPLGYASFAFASTPEQAMEQARLKAPDLATFDVSLLDGDGLAAARALEGVFDRLAMVFITGDPQAVAAGAPHQVVLRKPVSAPDLYRAVDEAQRSAAARPS